MDEIWKQCDEGDRCFYEISNLGNAKSISKITKKERLLKGSPNQGGYLQIRVNGRDSLIHTLVAYAFIGKRPDGLEIDHIDRNNQNNHVDNLRYCTCSENRRNRDDFRIDILETDRKERNKIYNRECNKKRSETKIECICGSITDKSQKSRHEKTQKHKKYLNENI